MQQYTIQNRNVHISVLNGALWDMELVHCGICEIDLLGINCIIQASSQVNNPKH